MNDHEYAMEYYTDYYNNHWKKTTPQVRVVLNGIIKDARDAYANGQTHLQIQAQLQNLLPNVPAPHIREIVEQALIMPHIPKMSHRKNKRVPESESDEEDLTEKLEKTHIK